MLATPVAEWDPTSLNSADTNAGGYVFPHVSADGKLLLSVLSAPSFSKSFDTSVPPTLVGLMNLNKFTGTSTFDEGAILGGDLLYTSLDYSGKPDPIRFQYAPSTVKRSITKALMEKFS